MEYSCVVCGEDLEELIDEKRGDEYATCTSCGRVFCTYHEGIDWENLICPKCTTKGVDRPAHGTKKDLRKMQSNP